MTYKRYVLSMIVLPEGDPIFSERVTIIGLVDDAAGPYIQIRQPSAESEGVGFDPDAWPAISDAVAAMIIQCNILESGATE